MTDFGRPTRRILLGLASTVVLIALAGCSFLAPARPGADKLIGSWTAVGEDADSDALGATLSLRADGTAIGRRLPGYLFHGSKAATGVSFGGTWALVAGETPVSDWRLRFTGLVIVEGSERPDAFELQVSAGRPTRIWTWIEPDAVRTITFARTSPD